MWYIYMTKYYSAIKQNEIMPYAATWMGLESVNWVRSGRQRRNVIGHSLYARSENKRYKWTYFQNRKRLIDLENTLMVPWGRGKDREFGNVGYTLLHSKWITNKDLLYSTWNSLYSVLCASLDERTVWRRMDACTCMAESLCFHLKLPQHC